MTTPKDVYQALLSAGASTVQAIGIMANVLNESRFDPEAVGDNGTSFGIVQEHGAQYAGLVTGNAAKDLAAQVNVLAQNGGFAAAAGQTPSTAAGNFAANYEKCQGCQPGGAQYNSRVANVATVTGWVTSGSWPTSAGSASLTAAAGGSSGGSASCAWNLNLAGPLAAVPVIGSVLPKVNVCVIKKTQVRAFLGALILVTGGLVVLPGLALVATAGFRASKTAQVLVQAVTAVPGGGRVAAGVRAAGGAARPAARSGARAAAAS